MFTPLFVLCAGSALAEEPSDALSPEELAAIEAALAEDLAAAEEARPSEPPAARAAPPQNQNPDLAFITDVALAGFTGDAANLQTGAHDPAANGFNLQQLELSAGKAVDPYFRFDANLVFSEFGVEIEEVYATTLAMPGRLQVRVGQFLTRFGRTNATHPHTWDFVDQPVALGRVFGAEANRGLGTELSWLTPLPWYVELVASETMIGGEATNRSWQDFTALGVSGPLDLQTTLAAKQFFALGPDVSLMWGTSWAVGPNGTGRENRSEVYGTDVYLKVRPISSGADDRQVALTSEWFLRRRQVPEDVLQDLNGFTVLTWRFAQRWGVGGRHELGTPELGSAGEVTDHALDPQWTSTRQQLTAAVTFWPTEFSRLRAQVGRDLADWIVDPAWAAFIAFEFSAGAHAAHRF